ncbi:MAG: serine/threonine protein kinase [Myxococcales bacterium]|nr:serine/threonine protein kinase [Myxococcales bacterium]
MTELPTTFGKYYLTEKLATGGMAEIYLAKLIGPGGFEKQLVIKQIHPNLTGQRHFVDLFVTEAKLLVTLAHGNIVPVYELGVVDEIYFIAMDYIDGPTLYRLTETMAGRDGFMEPAMAAWITARMLEGLDYAHRKGEGVIHRDLSPRNVMLSRDGEVKLVDFGIAVTLGEPGERESTQAAPTGSFPYMSPEQVRREPLTGQTDVFAVGVLFWEMLVGYRLFARPDAEATLDAVLHAEIERPSSRRPEIPAKLDEVVMRALERDKAARWPDAAEMLTELNRYLYSLDTTPGPRDLAALVARYCPPSTRRLPTHLEALAQEAAAAEPPPPAAGPRTAVIPRDGAAKGKRAQRHKTFATHVDLKDMLERATPMFGVEAIPEVPSDAAAPPTTQVAPRASQPRIAAPEPAPEPEATPEPRPGIIMPRFATPGRNPPGGALLVIAGLGVIGLSIAAVYVFYKGRDRVMRADAGPAEAATYGRPPIDAPFEDAPIIVAPPIDADIADAPADAGKRVRDGAAPHVAIDAGLAIDAVHAIGTATLEIGADPWGKVFVDGKLIGTAPNHFVVASGHHTIEIVFDAETPPRKQTFSVDLGTGEVKPLQADFH